MKLTTKENQVKSFVKIAAKKDKGWEYEEESKKHRKDNKKWREERKRNRDSKRRYED